MFNCTDESCIYFWHTDISCIQQTLSKDCNVLMEWFNFSWLVANPIKFRKWVMILCCSERKEWSISISVDDNVIENTDAMKVSHIGIHIEKNVEFYLSYFLYVQQSGSTIECIAAYEVISGFGE